MNITIAKALTFFTPPSAGCEGGEDRSKYERLSIPFTFKPQLSLTEALIAATAATLRIFLGCALFAVWGAYSLLLWSTIRSLLLRVGVLLPLFLAFLVSLALLMFAITAIVSFVSPRRP